MNPPYNFTFPQFDGGLGTLLNVNLQASVTLSYEYSLENRNPGSSNSRVRINRYDEISSPSIPGLHYVFYDTTTAQVQYTLGGSDGIAGSGADYHYQPPVYLMNNTTIINETFSNTADYIGGGDVTFEYLSDVGSIISGNINVDVTAQAQDEITFSITYTYCDNIVMNSSTRPVVRPQQPTDAGRRIFPNPSINGNFTLQFDNQKRADWLVEIYNSAGQLITRRKFHNSLKANFDNTNLASGIYLIKSTNIKSQEGFVERLIIK